MRTSNQNNKTILLLTGCVNPGNMLRTALLDTNVRRQQYIDAISFYLANTQYKLLFVENSGVDLSFYFENEITSGRLEILSFFGNDFDINKGKGYGEALILSHAFSNSIILKDALVIVKITGRLIVENVNTLVREVKKDRCIYANYIKHNVIGIMCQSFFFISPVIFLKNYFLINMEAIDDSNNYFFEKLLYDESENWIADGYSFREFRNPIIINGQSGSTGRMYLKEKYPYLRNFLRLLYHKSPIYMKKEI